MDTFEIFSVSMEVRSILWFLSYGMIFFFCNEGSFGSEDVDLLQLGIFFFFWMKGARWYILESFPATKFRL